MKRILIGALIFILFIALIVLAINLYNRSKRNPYELTLFGNVDVRQVDIGFRVAGIVDLLNYEEGDFVPKGTLVAVLDKTPFNSQLEEATANAEAIKPNLLNAEIHVKRRQELIGIGGVSQEDLDNAIATRDQLKANLDSANNAKIVAMDNLSYTHAYAPTDGYILTRIREPGTVVNPADPVYTLSVASPVWIRAYVDEPDLGKIYYGMEATIYTDTKGGPTYTGKIGFISPVAEFTPKTVESTKLRTDLVYRLRIYADNPDQYLKQGMPVTVKLNLRNQEKK